MLRIESSSAMSQGYLDFHCRSSTISLLGSGLGSQCKVGQGHKSSGPTIVPQNPATRTLGRGGGFGDVGPISWLAQLCPSLILVSFSLPWKRSRS